MDFAPYIFGIFSSLLCLYFGYDFNLIRKKIIKRKLHNVTKLEERILELRSDTTDLLCLIAIGISLTFQVIGILIFLVGIYFLSDSYTHLRALMGSTMLVGGIFILWIHLYILRFVPLINSKEKSDAYFQKETEKIRSKLE